MFHKLFSVHLRLSFFQSLLQLKATILFLFFIAFFIFNSSHNSFGVAPRGGRWRGGKPQKPSSLQLFQVAKRAVSYHHPTTALCGPAFFGVCSGLLQNPTRLSSGQVSSDKS